MASSSYLDDPPIIAIVGPTATGKTATAIHVAQALGGEIISADSMAVYRGMDIGTAKPSLHERENVRFHLLDAAEPDEPFSAARFKALANDAIGFIRSRQRRPIIAGGTGLYVRVLLEDYSLAATPADRALRENLDSIARSEGAPALHEKLQEVDPAAAGAIHPNDRVRIVRALEVFMRTGVPISAQQARDAANRAPRPALRFALTASREELYQRIDARVDSMIAAGLEEEVRGLISRGFGASLTPLRSLGYKEMVAYIGGQYDLAAAVQAIKQNTRRFAKRQLTWFRAEPEVTWIDIGDRQPAAVAEEILDRLPG